MKLHLPKMLLTALIAAGATTLAADGWENKTTNGFGYNIGDPTASMHGTIDATVSVGSSQIGDSYWIWSDYTGSEQFNLTVNTLTMKSGDTVTIRQGDWGGKKDFNALNIETLLVAGESGGAVNLIVGNSEQTNDKVVIKSVAQGTSLSSVINYGNLTIGTADATTMLSGSIKNSGVLNLSGVIEIADFDTIVEGSLSNATHGFRTGEEKYLIADGNGTINLFGVTLKVGEEEKTLEDGALTQTPIAISTGNTSTSTVYEITSAYTTAVEYNGTTGDTATATGFRLENGTTLKLTGTSTANLTDKVTIAAGEGGKATYSIANGTGQAYASLGLGALIDVESGSYVLNIDGAGTVVTTDHSGSNGFHTSGDISITNGGKLVLQNKDALGWGTVTPNINIDNATLELGGRQTLNTNINMTGGATITAWDDSQAKTGDDAPMLHSYGATLTASGTGNVIDSTVGIGIEKTLTIEVTGASDELAIGGAFSTRNSSTATITKSGNGKLILNGVDKTINHKINLSAGTLQLGGTTADDGLVTLSSGIEQAAGTTLNVAGKAALSGSGILAGATNVLATGELTLNSTYDVTGSFTLNSGGKVFIGTGLTQVGDEVQLPEANTNGWSTSSVCVLTTSGSGTITGLNSVWDNDVEMAVSSSRDEETGITSYIATKQLDYYVQDTATKAEYSGATGLTGARAIYMSNGTTLMVKENLSTNKISVLENAAVNYEVDGVQLNLDSTTNVNIKSISVTNSGIAYLTEPAAKLGASDAYVTINLSKDGKFAFDNGNGSGADIYATINIDGSGELIGSYYGDNSKIYGAVTGNDNSLLKLTQRSNSTNSWKISGNISGNMGIESAAYVELSGANTYSGGTTVTGGTLTTANESALGTGKVTMNGGTLKQNAALSVSAMDYTSGTVNNNGRNLAVTGELVVKSDMEISGAGDTSIGTLDLTAGTTLTTTGSLTIGTLELDLAKYTDMSQTYNLVSTTGTDTTVTLTNAYTATVGNYTATVEGSGTDTLTLSFKNVLDTPLYTSVIGVAGYANGTLTLQVGEGLLTSEQMSVVIEDFATGVLDAIFELDGISANTMVGITLTDGTTSITATENGNVGFEGPLHIYYGENVGGSWQYNVSYIPEPATATLSLLALMGLAARRRRK